MCVRVFLYCQIKCLKHQLVIIALADSKGNNISALQIKNGTKIGFLTGIV